MTEIDCIFDRYGAPRLRLFDNSRFVNFLGEHLGFLKEDAVYNYQGQQVGWFEGGIMRDLIGQTIGFGNSPVDTPHPFLPFRQYRPYPGYIQIAPVFPFTQFKRFKPFKSYSWSELDVEQMFINGGSQ